MSDHKTTIGILLDSTAQRDAIHVAVAPVEAAQYLNPGQHVKLDATGKAAFAHPKDGIGIVDPYLPEAVCPGQRFYIFLYPNTVTGMRHHWEHPAFVERAKVEPGASEKWLRNFAEQNRMDYDEMISEAANAGEICAGTDFYSSEVPPDFWAHLEMLTGKTFNEDHREKTYWRCAC